jgi:hypothetical protein
MNLFLVAQASRLRVPAPSRCRRFKLGGETPPELAARDGYATSQFMASRHAPSWCVEALHEPAIGGHCFVNAQIEWFMAPMRTRLRDVEALHEVPPGRAALLRRH